MTTKIKFAFLALFISAAACTTQADDDGNPPGMQPDGGTGPGPDGGTTADEPIPEAEKTDVCTTYKQGDREVVSCLKKADGYDFTGKQVPFVGFCVQEGFNGYQTGDTMLGTDTGTRIEFEMTGDVAPCEFTFGYWNGTTFVFAQFGRNVYPYDGHGAGFLRQCGDRWNVRNGVCVNEHDFCGMFVQRNPGHRPKPLGYYIPRNSCSPN